MPAIVKKKAKLRHGAPSKPRPKQESLPDKVDTLLKIDADIERLQIHIKALNEQRQTHEDALLETMQTLGTTSIKTERGSVSISRREVIGIDPNGWAEFTAFVHKYKAFDLIQRRVTQSAVKDREAEGEKVPGLKRATLVGLSISRVKVKS